MRESIATYHPKRWCIVVDLLNLWYIATTSWATHCCRRQLSHKYHVPHLQRSHWQSKWTWGVQGAWRWGSLRTLISIKSLGFTISRRRIQTKSAIFLSAAIRTADSPMCDPSINLIKVLRETHLDKRHFDFYYCHPFEDFQEKDTIYMKQNGIALTCPDPGCLACQQTSWPPHNRTRQPLHSWCSH